MDSEGWQRGLFHPRAEISTSSRENETMPLSPNLMTRNKNFDLFVLNSDSFFFFLLIVLLRVFLANSKFSTGNSFFFFFELPPQKNPANSVYDVPAHLQIKYHSTIQDGLSHPKYLFLCLCHSNCGEGT